MADLPFPTDYFTGLNKLSPTLLISVIYLAWMMHSLLILHSGELELGTSLSFLLSDISFGWISLFFEQFTWTWCWSRLKWLTTHFSWKCPPFIIIYLLSLLFIAIKYICKVFICRLLHLHWIQFSDVGCKYGLKNVTCNNSIIHTNANPLDETDRSSTYTYAWTVSKYWGFSISCIDGWSTYQWATWYTTSWPCCRCYFRLPVSSSC